MIILTKDNGIEIPNYDDLANKPKINGVILEGDLTSEELGIDLDTTRYYTKTESDNRFQPKGNYQPAGNYLTSIPSEYVTETELNEAIAGLDGNDVPYVCFLLLQSGVKDEYLGDLQAVIEAVKNKSPYFAYAYSGDDPNNYGSSIAPTRTLIPLTATYNNNSGTTDYRTGYFGYHTDIAADSTYPHLDVKINFKYDSSTQSYILNGISKNVHRYMTLEYYGEYLSGLKQDKLVSGTNIKTINGNSILGSGDLTIEGGTTDLSNYYTKTEADNKFQEKGDYLTSIPSEYITETELTNKGYATTTELNSKQDRLVSGTNIKTINGNSILGSGNLTIEGSGTAIPTMFIPQGASGTVDLSILTPIVDAIRNNTPWIVWGYMDATQGNYNMVECSSFSGDTITFYDNNLLNSIIRYWTFNLTDGTFTRSDNQLNFATKSYVDTQIGDINTILENIIG